MKKIFTLLTLGMTTMASWAIVPQLLFNGQPVEAGKTYQTGYTKTEIPLGPMTMTAYKQDSDLYLYGYLGEEVTVEVTASDEVQFCGIDGSCTAGTTIKKTDGLGAKGQYTEDGDYCTANLEIDKETNDLTGADPATLLTDITVKVKAYYTFSPNEYAEATVIMTKKPQSEVGGIADVINPATISFTGASTLNYNAATPTKLEIYNVGGALVMSRTIYQTGSISLDTLHPGVYIYSAGASKGKVLIHK